MSCFLHRVYSLLCTWDLHALEHSQEESPTACIGPYVHARHLSLMPECSYVATYVYIGSRQSLI